jgi:nitrous oxidase accessory protein NosD
VARSGDLVLVSPGTYDETVQIHTPRLTLRGTDRNRVIIDGQVRRDNGVVVRAPGVAVENLTVRDNLQNGVLVTGSDQAVAGAPGQHGYDTGGEPVTPLNGFRVAYVTAENNGLYGIYAFSATHGVIEQSYASGGADSGFYVGQCKPCAIVVRANIAERNAVGYEGTNASQGITVVGNRFVGNRVGVTLDSDHQEKLLPQQQAVLVGNVIADNNQAQSPEQAAGGFGLGVGIAGGTHNLISKNLIVGNRTAGLTITAGEDLPAIGNQVVANRFTGPGAGRALPANGTDVVLSSPDDVPGRANCLQANVIRNTVPSGLTGSLVCPNAGVTPTGTLPADKVAVAPPGLAFTDVPLPPAQPQRPDAAGAGPTVVPADPPAISLAAITVPAPTLLAARAAVRF